MFAARRKTEDGRLDQLRLAIQDRRVVRIDYYAYRKTGPETRDVEPMQLMYMSERWHLAAFCRLRKGPRMFRLDRIQRFSLLPDYFARGNRHVLPDNYEDWKADADEVRVRFHESIERWVRERQPFTFLREERDQRGPIFVYGIRREDDLVRWLLAWGASAEVLSPSRNRARIAAEIFTMYAQYAKNPDIRCQEGRRKLESKPDWRAITTSGDPA